MWGRLDEVQPTDVINPIDAARFLLDGRSAARLGVAFVRGRYIASDRFAVEGVLVPVFARGTYDAVRRSALMDLAMHTIGPALVSVTIIVVGLFILVLWARRRDPM